MKRSTVVLLGLVIALVSAIAITPGTSGAATRSTAAPISAPGPLKPKAATCNPCNPHPPGTPGGWATEAKVLQYVTGKRVGPAAWTYEGYFYINGFYRASNGAYYRTRTAAALCGSCIGQLTTAHPNMTFAETYPQYLTASGLSLPNWANPSKWNWKGWWGAAIDAIWNHCVSGTLKGLVGSAGSTLLVNLIARGGAVFVGPWGYAAIAIGGCIVAALD